MERVALVTGGSRGIGAAISLALKSENYNVAATYAGNEEAASKFSDETGIPTYKWNVACLLYTSPSPRDQRGSRMPSSA